MTHRRLKALLSASLLLAGCEFALGLDDLEVGECDQDADCGDGQTCSDHACVRPDTSGSGGGSSSVTSTGAGGNPDMSGVCMSSVKWDEGPLDGCLDRHCCDTYNTCLADETCAACIADNSPSNCSTDVYYQAFSTCFWAECAPQVCGAEYTYPTPRTNVCLNSYCCDEFTPCYEDPQCRQCLDDPERAGCDQLPLHQPFVQCRSDNCPPNICGTHIVYTTTYYNDSKDVNYDSISCAEDNCCSDLMDCVDPLADMDITDADVAACLACLDDQPSCVDTVIKVAAQQYNICYDNLCP